MTNHKCPMTNECESVFQGAAVSSPATQQGRTRDRPSFAASSLASPIKVNQRLPLNLLFKALRDPSRRRILEMLRERDLTVTEISQAFSMTTPSISYHLDLLKHANLVSARKNGQFVTYSLETTVLDDSLGWILDLIKKGKRKRK